MDNINKINIWRTSSEDKLKFITSVPFPETYSVMLKINSNLSNQELFGTELLNNGEIFFENKINLKPIDKRNNLYFFGQQYFNSGKYKTVVRIPSYVNVFPKIDKIVVEPYSNPFAISIPNIKEDQNYIFAYSYSSESTHDVSVEVMVDYDSGERRSIELFYTKANHDNKQEIIFSIPKTLSNFKKVTLYIDHKTMMSIPSPIVINKISLNPIVSTTLFIHSTNNSLKEREIPIFKKFIKILPTFYYGELEKIKYPFFLVFKEGFSSSWKVYVLKN